MWNTGCGSGPAWCRNSIRTSGSGVRWRSRAGECRGPGRKKDERSPVSAVFPKEVGICSLCGEYERSGRRHEPAGTGGKGGKSGKRCRKTDAAVRADWSQGTDRRESGWEDTSASDSGSRQLQGSDAWSAKGIRAAAGRSSSSGEPRGSTSSAISLPHARPFAPKQ